ncbi:PLD nuclease N-terminal domain-containing protein [Ilumatobacter nonamiensis]|uniref:PLD nuclease N-terminal domain-containing protein n=1 Tax=Ilumatobacter nonamiensis TaxID=467093 RepID=UPI000344F319|nr:PLD nuclease N-terminal domain-containing protein [Ilumatobacter nonamiensis]
MIALLAQFGTGQVLWSMLWFTLFFFWIWTVITVFSDIFRSDDLLGWGKALWTIFVIFLPFLGVFVYLIARGKSMQERSIRNAQEREQQFRSYVQETAATNPRNAAEEVARLAELHEKGVLSDDEFAQAKARALA